ncbi:MAG: Rod shape-determining protein RodA [Candidatus Curtissbacteria bacterium GW2011_GWA1_41_11]|uniref:Rod shape-determining protein RodA n=1 Tax=Candidatus Curtissbacteria bacterium GW2011_GWA1_41_11 TaxID=1618409 RepID=A0A0G0WP90_9BACT|nr:MAG: Rod shape-determining protein RodA [Candidatus Curtissbacteria bacterium GW2011_GWA1_41_11]
MTRGLDFKGLFFVLAIGAISLLVIFSINRSLFYNQLVFWVAGLAVFYLASRFYLHLWENLAIPLYILSLILLFIIFLIAEPVRGSVRWIDLGVFRIQPSEISKVAVILALANFFSSRSAAAARNIFLSFLIILPPAFLIVIQPDIGNALPIFAIWASVAFVAGFKFKHFLAISIFTIFAGLLLFQFLEPYQKARIETYINPSQDRLGTGYQIIQSKIAIGSGQLLGKGLGQGTQSQLKFLPEAESDFIFASIAESLGFFGSSLLVILYSIIIVRILSFAKTKSRFAQLVVSGAVAFLGIQMFINISMNMGYVPVTGITLPLVSYGGSSLLSTLFILGIVFSIKRHRLDA